MLGQTPAAGLERDVSSALLAMRCVEDAVFGDGIWTIAWGEIEFEATKIFTEDGVSFVAEFPEICYLDDPPPYVSLRMDGKVKGIQPIDHPGDTGFVVAWDFAVASRVPA